MAEGILCKSGEWCDRGLDGGRCGGRHIEPVEGGMDYITVGDLVRETGIPERTVRRYLERHKTFFSTRKESGVYYLAADSVELAKRIRCMYDAGKSTAQINAELTAANVPMVIEDPAGESFEVLPVAAVIRHQAEIREALEMLAGALTAERETSQELREALAAIAVTQTATQEELAALRQEVRDMAPMREPGGRGRDKAGARESAEILRELKATREALAAAEARGRRQEQQMSEIAEYVRAKPQEPARRRGWWPWAKR